MPRKPPLLPAADAVKSANPGPAPGRTATARRTASTA